MLQNRIHVDGSVQWHTGDFAILIADNADLFLEGIICLDAAMDCFLHTG